MKKHMRIVTLILAIILASQFPSCTKKNENPPESKNPAAHTDESQSEETTPETEPETTEPFDMPPETNELVVYSNSMTRTTLTAAVNFFKEQYPDVDVTYTNVSDDAYDDLLKTELAAGAGPDVVYTLDYKISDVYKLMLSSIFMNLDGFMDNDDSFNKDDYITGVFDSGVLNGKRYFAPIDFTAHSVLTTQEILDEEELTLDEIKTFDGYIDSIYNYNQKYADVPNKRAIYCPIVTDYHESSKLIKSFGSTIIDYENNIVEINNSRKDDFRALMDGIRKIYGMPVVDDAMGRDYEGLTEHICLYSDTVGLGGGFVFQINCRHVLNAGETPVVFIPQDPSGKVSGNIYSFAAIPEGAKNKLNAYRFLKIMLSDDFQGGEGEKLTYLNYCPVKKDAVYRNMTAVISQYDDSDDPEFAANFTKAVEMCAEVMMGVENAVLLPDQVTDYIFEEMTPYFKGDKEWDECFDRLMNVLTLYKDE